LQGVGAAAITTLACASVARIADEHAEEDEFARRGWLVGVAGSYAIETFEDDAESVDNSLGFNGRVGYRCHRRFSAEIEVEWLDQFKADVSAAGVGKIATIDLELVVVTANTKGYLLTGRYQPFLLVGAGFMTAEAKVRDTADLGLSASEKETDFAMRFGGGIDLYATKHVVVSVEADYVLPFGSLDDVDYISIGWGFQYRF
jgi:opacity protein-like surface antigen